MLPYVAGRLLQAVPLVLGILVLSFVLIHAAPGDPIYALAGNSGDAAYYAAMRAKFGLDRPVAEQLAIYLANALHGDFGYSYTHSAPVFSVITDRVPATLLLMLPALALSTAAGVCLGAQAAAHADRPADRAITACTLLGAALPAFWLGQILVIVFAIGLGLFPVQGMTAARGAPRGLQAVLDLLHHLVLPVLTLSALQLTLVTRLTRAGVRETLVEDYIRTGRAKGLSTGQVLVRHALPNALLPVVTLVGGQFGTLLTGAVLTEIIFAWPGLGRLLYDATLARDYPLLMGIFLVASLSVIAANLAVDLLYGWLDPRVRVR
ncbi:MAG: ABC transporter permease [Chloroflexota bacterium]|nr:ABC transporter permease [Chloroflexota bacterium]